MTTLQCAKLGKRKEKLPKRPHKVLKSPRPPCHSEAVWNIKCSFLRVSGFTAANFNSVYLKNEIQ